MIRVQDEHLIKLLGSFAERNELLAKIDSAESQRDERHEDILNQAVDYSGECGADYDAYRHGHHVSSDAKILEIFKYN